MFEMMYVSHVFIAYALLIVALWLFAWLGVDAMMRNAKKKSRVRLASDPRHRKLYVHSLSDDFQFVKLEETK